MKPASAGRMAVGHPVDVASGTLFQEEEDRALPGRVPLTFGRRYSSSLPAGAAGMFGPGWASPFEMRIRQDLDGYRLIGEDGETEIAFDDPGAVVASGGTLRSLGTFHELRRVERTLVVTRWDPEGLPAVRYVFPAGEGDQWQPLASRQDVCGHGVDVERDRLGRVVALWQRREGRGYRIEYNREGRAGAVYLARRAGGPAGKGRLILTYGYNRDGRLIEAADALGNRSSYEYGGAGRLVREVDRGGIVYQFRYDAQGRCVEAGGPEGLGLVALRFLEGGRATLVTDGLGHTTTYEHGPGGRVERVTSPLGNVTSTIYDAEGRVRQVVRPGGASTSYEYDERGNRFREVSPSGAARVYEFNDAHQIVAVTDPAGHRWSWTYDERGRLSASRNPVGTTVRFSYDGRGDLVEIAGAAGRTRRLEWDESGNLTGVTDWLGQRHTYEYDDQGQPTAFTDARGNQTRAVVDELGRLRELRWPDGAARRYGYNSLGLITESVDERGSATRMRFSGCGLIQEVVRPNGGRVRFEWCLATGRLLSVRNERGEEHRYAYDADRRPVGQTDFAGRTVAYEYGAAGHVAAVVNAAGQRTEFQYDPDGRLTEVAHDDGSGVKYEYDPRGYVVKADNGVCPVEREYDAAGRLCREKQGAHEIVHEFDPLGNRARRRSSLGHETAYAWDANGQLSRLTPAGFDPVHFEYDADMNEVGRFVSDRARIQQAFDDRARCVEQQVTRVGRFWGEGGHVPLRRTYSYDAASNLLESHDSWGAARYDYDVAGRVAAASLGEGFAERFAFDAADNVTALERRTGGTAAAALGPTDESRRYGPANELAARDGTAYEYDALGRLASRSGPRGRTTFRWDRFGQLAGVTLPDGAEWTYLYDPFGRRVRKRGASRETEFVWDGDVVLHELNSAGGGEATRTDWEFHPRGYAPVAKVEGGRQYLCVNDQLGTPRELLTATGSVVWAAQWTPFGEAAARGPREVDCPVRFPGQWFDEETGLHYNRLRYYDPQTGRYLSPDPLGLLGGLNPYQYTRCPVNWIDPLGLQDTLPLDGWRYSQTSAGGKDGVRYDDIRPSMEKGWDPTKPPVDVVRLPPENGGHLVGFDNTRPLIGQELGWHDIPVSIHNFHDPIDKSLITPHDEAWFAKMRAKGAQLSDPPTWGELLKIRTENNGLPLEGTTDRPKVIRKCPK